MYRKFKGGQAEKGVAKSSHHGSCPTSVSEETNTVDPEVQSHVADLWKTILQRCSKISQNVDHKRTPGGDDSAASSTVLGEWRTVRIFVSSTFTDFFSEREILVKKVFPELREWCHEKKLKLIECDLRWGVPKDATSTQALLTCLEEIDRCYEANKQPFFLNMLGERYGWIPTESDVPAEVREKYSWVDGTSMTFMEIMHGALSISNPNAAFFLRDPAFISELPSDHASRFLEDSPLAKEHLKVLRSYLKEHFPQQIFPYSVQSGGVSMDTGREMVQLTGLEEFAAQVTEFFKTAIERTYPTQTTATELTPEEREVGLQWMFVQDKAETLIGRDKELKLLLDYSCGTPGLVLEKLDGKDSTVRKAENWDCEEGDSLLCAVIAEGGWGKTALLAGLVRKAIQEGQKVFYHFVGSTASSKYHENVVQRLILALAPDATDPEITNTESDEEARRKLLRKLLADWRKTDKEMLIVVDGVNELDNSESLYHLTWLPPVLPPSLRCVVSANVAHRPTTARLLEHPVYRLTLSALDVAALKDIASDYLGKFGKKLDASQLQQLVETTKVDNPLWISLMCEELRVFGDFRTMDRKLAELPDTMDGFLNTVIKRLLTEDDSGYVKKALYMVVCSMNGLPLDYIHRLMGDIEEKEECPPLYWAQARRVLKPYSRTIRASGDGEEFFMFVHESMYKAVRQCMTDLKEDATLWHKRLANFYQYWCDKKILRINYLPYHLHNGRLQPRLIAFLQKDRDAASLHAIQRGRYLNELRCYNPADKVMPSSKEVMICMVCSRRQGSFNPGVLWPNKDCCYICNNLVHSSHTGFLHGMIAAARLCSVHAMKDRMGPNVVPCCICKQPIFINTSTASASVGPSSLGPVPAVLCQFCGFGLNGKRCCAFRDFPN